MNIFPLYWLWILKARQKLIFPPWNYIDNKAITSSLWASPLPLKLQKNLWMGLLLTLHKFRILRKNKLTSRRSSSAEVFQRSRRILKNNFKNYKVSSMSVLSMPEMQGVFTGMHFWGNAWEWWSLMKISDLTAIP